MARFLFFDDKIINILLKDEKPSGGAAVQAYGWIRGLSEAGQEVYVLTNTSHNGPIKEECKEIKLVPMYDKQKGLRLLRWAYYRLPHIYQKIKQIRPHYLYQGVPSWTSFFIGLMCRQLGVKYIMRISNDYLLDDRFYKNYSKTHRYFLRLGFRLSYCILCQNEYQLSIIQKDFPGKRAVKIANPVSINIPDAPEAMESRKYIAWLGLYQYQKNMPLLYEIALKLKGEQFLIAGKESSKCDTETQNYLEKLKALPNVSFAGFLQRDEVLPFLSGAKFLLNTSHYEGFSNTFLEAMSVGTPIISSTNVNPDGFITANQIGLVYKDSSDLQHQYEALNPLRYQQLSENAMHYVVENHDYRSLAKRLLNILRPVQPEVLHLPVQSFT
jgi:glycosyltransferase involved in cell wall biosynthesis